MGKLSILKDVQRILEIQDTVRFAKQADRKIRALSGKLAKYQFNRAALLSRMSKEGAFEVLGFDTMSDLIDSYSEVDGISRNSVYRWIRAYDNQVTRPLIGKVGVSKLDHLVRAHSALQEVGLSEEEASGRVTRMADEVQSASETILRAIAPKEEVSQRKGKPLTTDLTRTLADEMIRYARDEGKTTLQKVKDELAQIILERKRVRAKIAELQEREAELAEQEKLLREKVG